MGKVEKDEKRVRFQTLETTISDHLIEIRGVLKKSKELEGARYGYNNAVEVIKMQSEIREKIKQSTGAWRELEDIYKKETRKRKSKFSETELKSQSEVVQRLYTEIESLKNANSTEFAADDTSTVFNKSMSCDSSRTKTFGGPSWRSGSVGCVELTSDQQQRILQLEERDADFDRQLDEICNGMHTLATIARCQGEEITRQSQMLDSVDKKMNKNSERMNKLTSGLIRFLNK